MRHYLVVFAPTEEQVARKPSIASCDIIEENTTERFELDEEEKRREERRRGAKRGEDNSTRYMMYKSL